MWASDLLISFQFYWNEFFKCFYQNDRVSNKNQSVGSRKNFPGGAYVYPARQSAHYCRRRLATFFTTKNQHYWLQIDAELNAELDAELGVKKAGRVAHKEIL